jgi:hypothetical protein
MRKPQVIFNLGIGPKSGLDQSKECRNRYAQFSPLWRRLLKRFNNVEIFRREVRWRLNSPHEFCAHAAGGPRDCRDRPGRRDPACTFRPLRDRAVTGVTGVIAVIVVIAGIVSSGPVRAARTVAKGAVSPVTAVFAGRLRRDLRAGRDRRDSSRSSRSHGGHGPTVGAVTAP